MHHHHQQRVRGHGYFDRDSGGGTGYQRPTFPSTNHLQSSRMESVNLGRPPTRDPRPPCPSSLHRNLNGHAPVFNRNNYSPSPSRVFRGQGSAFTPRPRASFQFQHREIPLGNSRGYPNNFGARGEPRNHLNPGWQQSYPHTYQPGHRIPQSYPRNQMPCTVRPQWNSTNIRSQSQDSQCQDSPDKPWVNQELLNMIRERNQLYEAYNRTGTEESFRLFKVKRIEVNMACNDAKILYLQKYPQYQSTTTAVYNPRPYWKPVPQTFYCDPCDRKLPSQAALDEHNAEHITCKLDGCTYTAHAKLVMKHIELQHSNNLYDRIKGYDTPEEIRKWKEERRLGFPTPENILRKKEERAEMRARGETMGFKQKEEEEIFRHKIVPEKRSYNSSRDNTTQPNYQSDGEEDVLPKKMRLDKVLVSSYNTSPIVSLVNYYTDIDVNENGQLLGFTRNPWMRQKEDDEDTECKNFNTSGDENEDVEEFNITDDEEDGCGSNPNSFKDLDTQSCSKIAVVEHENLGSQDTNINTVKSTSFVSTVTQITHPSTDRTSRTGHVANPGLLGLSSYSSSDSDNECEGEVDESILPAKVPQELVGTGKSNVSNPSKTLLSKKSTYTQDKANDGSSSDDEPPEELATLISKSPTMDSQDDESLNLNENKFQKPCIPNKKKIIKRIARKILNPVIEIATADGLEPEMDIPIPRYTLLQRLLTPDIRRERNLILQGCRYIVDNNFFDQLPKISEPTDVVIESDTEANSSSKNS